LIDVVQSSHVASHARDDAFHEIQLNGKQLVFMFMAVTVVSVVIFLCGVLVGRGVRVERTRAAEIAEPSAVDQLRDSIDPGKPPTVQQTEDPTKALPPTPAEGGASPQESLPATTAVAAGAGAAAVAAASRAADQAAEAGAKPVPRTTVGATAPVSRESSRASGSGADASPSTPTAKPPTANASSALPAADDRREGWVVQVAAVNTRAEADGIARQLGAKGYAAFVQVNGPGMFRVRVGGYKARRDADAVADKLRKEERISPWVTR
jgi:cell division septation protein DedD